MTGCSYVIIRERKPANHDGNGNENVAKQKV